MYQEAVNHQGRSLADYAGECAQDNYSSELASAKQAVAIVSERLRNLADAICGPRPEPAEKNTAIAGQRSLKDSLEHTPGEIREISMKCEKQIEEIRVMLRL